MFCSKYWNKFCYFLTSHVYTNHKIEKEVHFYQILKASTDMKHKETRLEGCGWIGSCEVYIS